MRLSGIARALQRAVLRGLALPATVTCGCGAQTEGGSPTCAVSSTTTANCGCGCTNSTFPLSGTLQSCGGDDAGASWPLPPSQCTALCPRNPSDYPAVSCSISANTYGPLGGTLTTSLTLSCMYTVPFGGSFVSFDSGVQGIDAFEGGTNLVLLRDLCGNRNGPAVRRPTRRRGSGSIWAIAVAMAGRTPREPQGEDSRNRETRGGERVCEVAFRPRARPGDLDGSVGTGGKKRVRARRPRRRSNIRPPIRGGASRYTNALRSGPAPARP